MSARIPSSRHTVLPDATSDNPHPEIFPLVFLFPSQTRKHENEMIVLEFDGDISYTNSGSLNASSYCNDAAHSLLYR